MLKSISVVDLCRYIKPIGERIFRSLSKKNGKKQTIADSNYYGRILRRLHTASI